jgi:pimeloyl-ACP methyl ester carboxylesterase
MQPLACDAVVAAQTTPDGTEFVRTPDSCFEDLPDWPFAPAYVDIDGLRQAYVEAGPADGPVVLLLHGQPTWSYLYRKMVPILADAGYRVIAMDHLGMGRSDKPTAIARYSYLDHAHRLERFIEALALRDINLFVQDWGSLIGLRVAGLHPDWFARIAVGDGTLPVVPAGVQPFLVVEDPDVPDDSIMMPFGAIPDQQVPFFTEECPPQMPDGGGFDQWMRYALKAPGFHASEVVEALTWFDVPADEEAAYDAPFPSRTHMAGVRVFPSLVNDLSGLNADAWAGLTAFEKPFLTLWAANDPGNLGRCETQDALIEAIPGAVGQPHDRLPEASHFLQDDQGPEIARRLVEFFRSEPGPRFTPPTRGSRYCEILLVDVANGPQAEVWGTQGINDCPAAQWEAIDPQVIQAERGLAAVIMNGPRYWLPNRVRGAGNLAERQYFGALEMHLLATVEVDLQAERAPYREVRVDRSTTYHFDAGEEIYTLTAPDGETYVMQAMAAIVDPELTLDDLAALGDRLMLPEGWSYAVRRLDSELVMVVEGQAVVIQDELQNTYQRMTDTPAPPPMMTPPPVLEDGTGTPCEDDADCAEFVASSCLSQNGASGICTIEGCGQGQCGAGYLCCGACRPEAAALLLFEGSACLPEGVAPQLMSAAGCTCE